MKKTVEDLGSLNFGYLTKANVLVVNRSRTGIVIPFANLLNMREPYGIKTH